MQSALSIKESFPNDYIILERPKKERVEAELPLAQLIEKIKTAKDANEIQGFTQDPRKTVREATTKRLNEILLTEE